MAHTGVQHDLAYPGAELDDSQAAQIISDALGSFSCYFCGDQTRCICPPLTALGAVDFTADLLNDLDACMLMT